MGRFWTALAICGSFSASYSIANAQGERVCQTPDCLVVENHHSKNGVVKSIGVLDTRLHLYVFVPPSTRSWKLEVFDQNDDNPNAAPSQFELWAPDGTLSRTLDAPKKGEWASYTIESGKQWGVWRLSITGPQDLEVGAGDKAEKARNAFMVRTKGEVDLYLKPESVARVRGLRLGEPHFGGSSSHDFTLQNLNAGPMRFNLLRRAQDNSTSLQLGTGAKAERFVLNRENDDRLSAELALETVEFASEKAPTLLPLHVRNVRGDYGLGVESEGRLFFSAAPLMPLSSILIDTRDAQGRPVAARIEITSPQTSNESQFVYSDASGHAEFWGIKGVAFKATATRGAGFGSQAVSFSSDAAKVAFSLSPVWTQQVGWFGGDSHCHTSYYDGTNTPRQMVEAAQSAGLNWLVVSEHGHSEKIDRAVRANSEAAVASGDSGFVMVPGMEYTGPQFHANILGGLVRVREGATLAELLAAVKEADTPAHPLVCQLNHPTLGKTAAQIARETPQLSLVELWNSAEPEATKLWFELMNRGQKVWANAGSDSHNRNNLEVGSHRTLVYLGAAKADAGAIIRALRGGHSVLSRGATLDFRVDGRRPGDSLQATKGTVEVSLETQSARPIERVEIVARGEVIHRFAVGGKTSFSKRITLPAQNGWMLARVVERGEKLPLALSNPVWISQK